MEMCAGERLFSHSVIRHQQASQGPWDTTDKFRIDLYQGNRLMGRKHLNSSLTKHTLPSKPDGIEVRVSFNSIMYVAFIANLSNFNIRTSRTPLNIMQSHHQHHHRPSNKKQLVCQSVLLRCCVCVVTMQPCDHE